MDDHQRLARRGLLQEHRRRRDVDEEHERPARRPHRQGEPRGHGRESEPHLRAHRSEAGRRPVPHRRRGRLVGAREFAGIARAAPVLLHHARRRSDQRGRGVRRRRGILQVHRRRQDDDVDAHAARRQPRHLDQPEGRQHDDPVERRRRERVVRRRAHLVVADEPADVGDLRRVARQRVPVQALRRAAGRIDRDHHEHRESVHPRRLAQRPRLRNRARSSRTRRTRTPSTARARDSTR